MATVENQSLTTRPGGATGRGFIAGQSGNPGGRPRGLARRVRELVGDNGELNVSYMVACAVSLRVRAPTFKARRPLLRRDDDRR